MQVTVLGSTFNLCDPWFTPAFFGSWFPFPRNDNLDPRLVHGLATPGYLYVSHQPADHLDPTWLAEPVDLDTPVLHPGFPTGELELDLRGIGFRCFIRTEDGAVVDLGVGVHAAIHVETFVADGPGGDSALVAWDHSTRIVNQNDCRVPDPNTLRAYGSVDVHALQLSGAIWYPMVYEMSIEQKRQLEDQKVAAQFARATRYVRELVAQVVIPAAGPLCLLDDDMFDLNVVPGDELSILPDQTRFIAHLADEGLSRAVAVVPGSRVTIDRESLSIVHSHPEPESMRTFTNNADSLAEYRADWGPWLDRSKAEWPAPARDALAERTDWWEPLLALAPALGRVIDGCCLVVFGDDEILVHSASADVSARDGRTYVYRFAIPRQLLEMLLDPQVVDWFNSFFLSCRFTAWRSGDYNEFVHAFLKSMSPERMARVQQEAQRYAQGGSENRDADRVDLGPVPVQRHCPHRQADSSLFGVMDGDDIVCTDHGWRFSAGAGAPQLSTSSGARRTEVSS